MIDTTIGCMVVFIDDDHRDKIALLIYASTVKLAKNRNDSFLYIIVFVKI